MAWTSPRTWVAAEIVTASLLNTHVRDNQLWLASTTGLVQHEAGGVEADISAITTGGIVRGTGAGTMGVLAGFLTAADLVKHEYGGLEFDASGVVKGDLISGTGSGTMGLKNVGTDGYVVIADSASAGGIKYDPANNHTHDPSSVSVSKTEDEGGGATNVGYTAHGFTQADTSEQTLLTQAKTPAAANHSLVVTASFLVANSHATLAKDVTLRIYLSTTQKVTRTISIPAQVSPYAGYVIEWVEENPAVSSQSFTSRFVGESTDIYVRAIGLSVHEVKAT